MFTDEDVDWTLKWEGGVLENFMAVFVLWPRTALK